jgi:phosphoribosylformimino-5-aminoimidazole carboxamide ribotide isomerase
VIPRPRSTFEVYPAIDLRHGRVVRLRTGDFAQETVYGDDPVTVAAGFAGVGARWIHVVDLDGARAGAQQQIDTIGRIVECVAGRATDRAGSVRVQAAGGIRSLAAARDLLARGVDRVVLGTAALEDPPLARDVVDSIGSDRVAVAIDVRDGLALGHGWVTGSRGLPVEGLLEQLASAGVTTFVVTAIARDGLLGGPDLELLGRCVTRSPADVIASGGLRSVADIEAVAALGCRGAIIGRALYEGVLDLGSALAAARHLATNARPV